MANAFLPGGAMIPRGIDLQKWSVVACDQYTSEPDYWQRVEQLVGDAPSTLNMILPELYLNSDTSARFDSIGNAMQAALEGDVLQPAGDGYILVERTQRNGAVRWGIIGRLDLEAYDYTGALAAPIRSTEGTVLERLPPRIKARQAATLELPHVMLLIDDDDMAVIEPSTVDLSGYATIYDTELMERSGHLRGFMLDVAATARIARELDRMFARPMAIAVGDGNHSLAAAKACWELIKPRLSEAQRSSHPARYALCELVNLHSPALEFEPIHRVVSGVNATQLSAALSGGTGGTTITIVTADGERVVESGCDTTAQTVAAVQQIVDGYIADNGGEVDYVHGDDVARGLGSHPDSVAVLLPVLPKSELFTSVERDGALPRKTFSMGEAHDKRFYFEARVIG